MAPPHARPDFSGVTGVFRSDLSAVGVAGVRPGAAAGGGPVCPGGTLSQTLRMGLVSPVQFALFSCCSVQSGPAPEARGQASCLQGLLGCRLLSGGRALRANRARTGHRDPIFLHKG